MMYLIENKYRIKAFISREILSNMLSFTNFDFKNISNEKSILYIIGGTTYASDHLIPLIINILPRLNQDFSTTFLVPSGCF